MTNTKEVTPRETTDVQKARQEREIVLTPPVDIYEDAEGITLTADMPGVSKDRLTIEIERDALRIEGDARIEMPQGIQALHADVRATRYRRNFALSGELETDKIEAGLKDGVLTLRIPKRAELRPRKVEVRTG